MTPATGELRKLASGWAALIRIEGKVRKSFDLAGISPADEAAAKGRCAQLASMAVRLRRAGHAADAIPILEKAAAATTGKGFDAVAKVVDGICAGLLEKATTSKPSVTFGDLAKEWTDGKLHERFRDHVESKRTSDHDALRLAKYVYPVAGDVPLRAFTEAHALEIMSRIPADKSRATRRHVAQLMTRVLNLAVYPCRHIERSPLPKGFLPKIGKGKALAYLYPDEDRTLLACAAVPFVERLFYGFLAREGLRSEEAQSLTWKSLDLARGSIRIDFNKTDEPRTWVLDPGVVRALRAWKASNPDDAASDRVFRGLAAPYHLAIMFRGHLARAGVDRPELFEKNEARRPIRIHDLRATFITVNLANGRTESWIADRTGHTTSAMINRYRRSARSHVELEQGELTPLDQALAITSERHFSATAGDHPAVLWRPQGDSNPC